MKEKRTQKKRDAKENSEKAASKKPLLPLPMPMPYFPERLPKLYTLRPLLATLINIMECIIKKIKPNDYSTVWENNQIFTRAFGNLVKSLAPFMYFAIRNGTHYVEAMEKVGGKEWKFYCM
jgi:hypothetical protein